MQDGSILTQCHSLSVQAAAAQERQWALQMHQCRQTVVLPAEVHQTGPAAAGLGVVRRSLPAGHPGAARQSLPAGHSGAARQIRPAAADPAVPAADATADERFM